MRLWPSATGTAISSPNQVCLGGSMNYDELPLYGGLPPRSNGRAVIRSTNGGSLAPDVTWQDITAVLGSDGKVAEGIHPDLHAAVFNPQDSGIAFIGSDGGVVRIDVRNPQDTSAACDSRKWAGYTPAKGPQPLAPADKLDCQRLLSGIPTAVIPINDGLNDIQFQSLSVNPSGNGELLGGTQDNGTWAFKATASDPLAWFESVGGDGGQSGFDKGHPTTRYHNYYDATPRSELPWDGPEGVAEHLRPAPVVEGAALVLHPIQRRPGGVGTRVHGPGSCLAHGRQRR